MSDKIPFDFDEYIRQSEPDKQQKGYIWQTAIGLQDVDGLKPSDYLIETAKKNIDGEPHRGSGQGFRAYRAASL